MTIEQTDVVDFVSIDKASGSVLLSISDHLSWDVDEGSHLLLLQSKLNLYLHFVESNEIFHRFPETKGRPIVISVFGKFPLSAETERFFGLARERIRQAGFDLQFVHDPRWVRGN